MNLWGRQIILLGVCLRQAVGIQIQRVSGWKQHLGLKARNTRKESGIQGRVEALSDLQRDGS